MGAILRLDGRCVIEEQEPDRVDLVTRVVEKGATGRVWSIGPHPKPELRLKAWSKGKLLRVGAPDVVDGYGGTLDYHQVPRGIYLADTATHRGELAISAAVVFRVSGDAAADQVEVLASSANVAAQKDRVVAELSGWDLPRLRAERQAYADSIASAAAALGFVALEYGSWSQQVWANELRRVKFASATEYLERRRAEFAAMNGGEFDYVEHKWSIGWLETAMHLMLRQTDATWWTAQMDRPGRDILRAVAKQARNQMRAGQGVRV